MFWPSQSDKFTVERLTSVGIPWKQRRFLTLGRYVKVLRFALRNGSVHSNIATPEGVSIPSASITGPGHSVLNASSPELCFPSQSVLFHIGPIIAVIQLGRVER